MKKHSKLLTVLLFAAMVLILGLLVASVTSCSPTSETIQPTPTVQPSLIVKPTPTWNRLMERSIIPMMLMLPLLLLVSHGQSTPSRSANSGHSINCTCSNLVTSLCIKVQSIAFLQSTIKR